MSKIEYDPKLAELNGSEQHHDLKNQPGEKGDADHNKSGGTLSGDLGKAVEDGEGGTALADELKKVAD